jgi:hypothetical protein
MYKLLIRFDRSFQERIKAKLAFLLAGITRRGARKAKQTQEQV